MRKAKIICTLGPASESLRMIEDLAAAGMSVARINASHGDREELRALLERVREVDSRIPTPLATMLDLQGPEIRTAPSESPLQLEAGTTITFVEGTETNADRIGLSRSLRGVDAGDQVLLDDGRIETVVVGVHEDAVEAKVESGGLLESRQGVNVPGVDLELPMVTEKDRADLTAVADDLVDFVAASFVRDATDIFELNEAVEEAGGETPIVAKIERADAVANMDSIIDAADGIMVARGDLGVECPMEEVPIIQKQLIRRSQHHGVPVVTATEMLDSMVEARRPTRAEASDVANAVLDGADAVMLSAETAVGAHPVRVVETMDRIVSEVESSEEYAELREQRVPPSTRHRTDALARAGRYLARDLGASAIVAVSESGYTAINAAKFRPEVPIVAATTDGAVTRRLSLSWGIHAVLVDRPDPSVDDVIADGIQRAIGDGMIEPGDTVVVLVGMIRELPGAEMSNTLKIEVTTETLATGRVVVPGRASGPLYRIDDDGDLTALPSGAIAYLPTGFDGEFVGDPASLGGVVSVEPGLTGYAAVVARECGLPMISGASMEADVPDGTLVTIDARRGVVYAGEVNDIDATEPEP